MLKNAVAFINAVMNIQHLLLRVFVLCFAFRPTSYGQSERDTTRGQWPTYGGDLGSSKYSPLDQITRENVKDLAVAWVWNSSDDALNEQLKVPIDDFKGTPLMIDGVLYVRTSLNPAVAIDAETGQTLWGFNPESYKAGRPGSYGFTTRSLAYWADTKVPSMPIRSNRRALRLSSSLANTAQSRRTNRSRPRVAVCSRRRC